MVLFKPVPFTIAAFLLFLSSCDPDEPLPVPPPEYPIEVELSHSFGNDELLVNGPFYLTENGDSFQLSKLVYHINHFRFFDENGKLLSGSEDYFMVDLSKDAGPVFRFPVVQGRVAKVQFTIGVADSLTNYNGDLNSQFTDAMYWGMISGYIHFKLEGISPKVLNGAVVLHTGGYTEPFKTYRTITVELGTQRASSSPGKNHIGMNLDLSRYFYNPNLIDLSQLNLLHSPNEDAVKIADNWMDMFQFTGLK